MKRAEFSDKVKLAAFELAEGKCQSCGRKLFTGDIHYDHIIACEIGGTASPDNCQVLCRSCHRTKTSSRDMAVIVKARRSRRHHLGIRKKSTFRGWRKFDGSPVRNPTLTKDER